MTYLTVPISATEIKEAISQISTAKKGGAEAVELRTDYLDRLEAGAVKKLIIKAKETGLPVIVTCRDKKEGGAKETPLKVRIDVLTSAIKAGAEFVDFEYENFRIPENQRKIKSALAKNKKTRLILSAHNFKKRFDDIEKLYRDISGLYPAAIPKLVYTANHINDCFEAFDLLGSKKGDVIALCMGEAGEVSRIIAKKLGGLVTYASLNEKSATAAGQITIEKMKKIYRWERIDADTELYGIIGSPVGHSLSPLIHNRCFAEIKANKLYLPLLVEGGREQLSKFMENVLERPWLGFRGFSVTIPHKENALEFVKQKGGAVEPLAEKIGAVNTILIEHGASSAERRVKAYNTDYAGAMDAITAGMDIRREDLKDLPVAVIGAGGVARAIVAGLSDCGTKIKIYNRTIKRAQALAEEFGCGWAGLEDLKNIDAKLVINCTSIGMKKTEYRIQNTEDRRQKTSHETPVPQEYLKKGMTVFDTVYNPAETLLLKQAKEVGAGTISGVDMFVNQAAEQFKLFTGSGPDIDIMRKIITNRF
jgi:3-dehydroquinate dehydratase/shikimate dehydrogenase